MKGEVMTEEEAKTKWCPQCVSQTDGDAEYSQRCLGSGCMAWRWIWTVSPYGVPDFVAEIETKNGYCGLAGKP